MTRYLSYVDNSLVWDHIGQQNSFKLSGLRDVRDVSQGRGVLYFWFDAEGRSGNRDIAFYQQLSVATEFKIDETGPVSFGLNDQAIFPAFGIVSLTDEGFIVAPSLRVKTAKDEIALMFISPSTVAPIVVTDKNSLSAPNGEETVTVSTADNEVHCRGSITSPFKAAHIVLNRNPNLPVYEDGFNQEIGETKAPGEINVTWKPVCREFEEHLIAFYGSRPAIRIVDDLLNSIRWSKDSLDDDPGDYVVGDGIGIAYTLRLVLDRGLGRHVSDETSIRIARP